ncbi:MAG: hypothetical protein APZ16_04775 [Candidatus Hadarchaeum yellowstonense]|jgi:hypothetical protein|uniref:Uncharacterized protein n=1 Tax=Hadarchaeum yellowstonense TaxID=1776334 RepID=A0A147JTM1_HADYE|nr:MAG: hypothetical protein APZ16_04775 [Candidatus Hadarchaeum yellowstonense]
MGIQLINFVILKIVVEGLQDPPGCSKCPLELGFSGEIVGSRNTVKAGGVAILQQRAYVVFKFII